MTADTAWLPDEQSVVQLDTDVVVTTRASTGARRILYTEQMQIDTSLNQAVSDFPVRIESRSGIVTGTGFHADMNTHRMKLHNQVRSKHEENDD